MPTLTDADMADHCIRFRDSGDTTVSAAYVTTEEKHPDMLAFKDHLNRTVLLVSRVDVLTVERLEEREQVGTPLVQLPPGMIATAGQIAVLQAAIDAAVHPRKVVLLQNIEVTQLECSNP
jgi:hypothetical protein